MKKNKPKKLMAIILALCICAAGAFAAWKYSGTDDVTFDVTSTDLGGGFTITTPFMDTNLDLSGSADATDSSVVFNNPNGETNAYLYVDYNVTDIADGCSDFEDDCDWTLIVANSGNTYDENTIIGATEVIPSGANNYKIEISCVANSCPQTIDAALTLEQV